MSHEAFQCLCTEPGFGITSSYFSHGSSPYDTKKVCTLVDFRRINHKFLPSHPPKSPCPHAQISLTYLVPTMALGVQKVFLLFMPTLLRKYHLKGLDYVIITIPLVYFQLLHELVQGDMAAADAFVASSANADNDLSLSEEGGSDNDVSLASDLDDEEMAEVEERAKQLKQACVSER